MQVDASPCLFDTRAITGEGATFSEREGVVSGAEDHNYDCSDGGSGCGGDSDSVSASHHCSSNYLGSVLAPVNNLNVR
jgi:hypothetical protein